MDQEDFSKLSTYTITTHRHNFACWTAARAAQRGYATTKIITDAIEAAQLREKLSELVVKGATVENYDVFHEKMANELIKFLKPIEEELQKQKNINQNKSEETNEYKTTYGRVAKIIAIYVKTVYVLADPESAISKVAHPPIDSILLKELKIKGLDLKRTDWTKFDEEHYKPLISYLRNFMEGHPFWKLEVFWKAS